MSKILKGWELLKEIAEGKIKDGTRFVGVGWEENLIYKDGAMRYQSTEESLGFSRINSNRTFELKKDKQEINIQDIGRIIACKEEERFLANTLNKVIEAVKQLDKNIKEVKNETRN